MRAAALLLTVIVSGCHYASFIESRVPVYRSQSCAYEVCDGRLPEDHPERCGCPRDPNLERVLR